jgi:hypothetical protein
MIPDVAEADEMLANSRPNGKHVKGNEYVNTRAIRRLRCVGVASYVDEMGI